MAISPDGTRLAYASGTPTKLFTRRLDQAKATGLPGTEGASWPFFSADGQWVGFRAAGKVEKISVDGGAVVPLCDVTNSFLGASWGEDGSILVADSFKGLLRIPAGGGAAEMIAEVGKGIASFGSAQILPGAKAILFTTTSATSNGSIEVMTLADRHRKIVVPSGASPRYLAMSSGAGYLVYTNQATLFAIPFDLAKLESRGTAVPVLDDVAHDTIYDVGHLDFSRTGTLVYQSGGATGDDLLTVQWLDGAGKAQPLLAKPSVYGRPTLSPDGERLAVEVTDKSGTDIWVYDWQRDTMRRLTFTGNNQEPIWSPDGRYIVFRTVGEGMSVTRSDGAGKPQSLIQSKNMQYPFSFTADGKRLTFQETDPKTTFDLWTVPMESTGTELRAGKPEVFLQTPATERAPAISPDGRWMAYASDESGILQVYVRAFPDRGGKWQISNSDGNYPMWSHTGHELFFETLDDHIMTAAYTVKGDSFVAEKPRLWSEKQTIGFVKNVDLAPDGKRIVAIMPVGTAEGQKAQNHVLFLENFFDEVRRRVKP